MTSKPKKYIERPKIMTDQKCFSLFQDGLPAAYLTPPALWFYENIPFPY
jgi:hypothetical protein